MKVLAQIQKLQPLSSGVILDLLLAASTGDRGARRKILTAFLPLLLTLAIENVRREDLDDALGEATLLLDRAVTDFDPGRGRPFASFAAKVVRTGLREWTKNQRGRRVGPRGQRAFKANPIAASLDAPVSAEGDLTGHDVIADASVPDAASSLSDCHTAARAVAAMKHLSPAERWIVQSHLMTDGPVSFDVLASNRGVSRQALQQTEARAIKKLRATLTQSNTRPVALRRVVAA